MEFQCLDDLTGHPTRYALRNDGVSGIPINCPALSQLRLREVVWVDWLGAEGEQVCIRGAGQGVKRLSPSVDFAAKELGLAVRLGVGDKDFFRERGDKPIALLGALLIGAAH